MVLKSFKTKRSGPKAEKNWPGRVRAEILYFVSDRVGLRPKFQFLFQADRAETAAIQAGPGPGLKNTARADL